MNSILLIPLVILVFIPSAGYLVAWRARTRGLPYPPGPKGLPILGNLFNMPTVKQWRGFKDLSMIYGEPEPSPVNRYTHPCSTRNGLGSVLYFKSLGRSVLVLGSIDVIDEYLNKRSLNTSDRKQTPLIELCVFPNGGPFLKS